MTGRGRVCAQSGGANSSSAVHVAIADRRKTLRTLNLVMIDAYLHDEVDYFYVAYDVVKPTDVDLFDSSSILSNRYLVSPFIRAQFSEVV